MSPAGITPDQFSTFGELLRHLRRQARLTQRELAIAVGYSHTQISRIEQNQRVPDAATITGLFVPALFIEDQPKWVARLLELAKTAPIDGEPQSEILPTGTVTFLFTDIEGSTKLAREYPDAIPALLARHHEILKQSIQVHNGYSFQIVGDSIGAAFHSAREALNAALEAQRSLHREAWSPAPIKVCMGIHTGTAHLQDASQVLRYSGYATLALTQRIMSAGHGGQILISQSAYDLVRDTPPDNAQLVDLGEHRLKDAPHAEHLYQLIVPDLPAEFPPLNTIKLFNHNLPAQLTSFIGREKEIAEIKEAIEKYRLVTLTGPGGTGKTRLSLQLAGELLESFPDGTWFVEFAPLADPALVPQVVVTTLGLIEQAGRSPLSILTDFLRTKRVFLILDNCEHLIQACAQLAEALLHSCPDLHILATSREMLGVTGESLYQVPALTPPDPRHVTFETLGDYEAVQLFVERAQTVFSTFSITHNNASAIAQVCYHLDGIPLALELAAARVNMMRVEEIAARLYDRFPLLTGGARTTLPRHQTLRALIDWSHDLLTEPERVLFRRLSIFAGGWTLEAAEKIAARNGQVKSHTSPITPVLQPQAILDLLASLVNKSLVLAERKQGQEARYSMLETIRQYAQEKLWAAGEGEILHQRHLAYYVDLAERAEPNLRAWDMIMWLDRLEAEHDNLRAALEGALESDVESQLRLASALLWFWHIRGYKNEGIDWLERGLSIEALEGAEKRQLPERAMIRGKALNVAGYLRVNGLSGLANQNKVVVLSEESLALFRGLGKAGRHGMAYALLNLGLLQAQTRRETSLLESSLKLFQEVGDKFGIAHCRHYLGIYTGAQGNYEGAKVMLEENLAIFKEIGDKDGIASSLEYLGHLAHWQGNYKQATILFEASVTLFREVRNKWSMSMVLSGLGDATRAQGDYDQAISILEEALTLGRDSGDRFVVAMVLKRLGLFSQSQGDYGQAFQMHQDALTLYREIGNQPHSVHSLWNLGLVILAQGDDQQAAKQFEKALTISKEAGDRWGIALAQYGLGKVEQFQGGNSSELYMKALIIFREITDPVGVAYCLEALAILAAMQKQMRRATHLFSASQKLYAPLRFEITASERAEHDKAIAIARAALGEETFSAASEEGKKMTLDQAIEYALEKSYE